MGFPQNSTESFTRDRVGHTPRYPREEKFLPNQWLIGYKLTNLRFGRRRSNSGMIHFWLTWIGEGEHWPERMGGAEDDSGQVGDQRPTYMPETLRWFPPSPQQVTSWALYWHPLSHFFLPLRKKSPGIHHPQFLSFLRNALVLFLFFFFGSAMKLVRILFPHQGLNPALAAKAPSPGQPGNSQEVLWNHFSLAVYFTTSTGELRHSPRLNHEVNILANATIQYRTSCIILVSQWTLVSSDEEWISTLQFLFNHYGLLNPLNIFYHFCTLRKSFGKRLSFASHMIIARKWETQLHPEIPCC